MELVIAAGLATLGYNINQLNVSAQNIQIDTNNSASSQLNDLPNNNNIYEGDYLTEVLKDEKNKASNLYNNSNLVSSKYNVVGKNKIPHKVNKIEYSRLTESNIDFTHNNMVPFFGGSVKQNMKDDLNSNLLGKYTGNFTNDEYQQKTAVEPLFKNTANNGRVFGTPNVDQRDRYNESKYRKNALPFEQIRVGSGLGLDYNASASGGFHQDTREYELPRNVDELRVKSNPKVTYGGRLIHGKYMVTKRQKDPNFTKFKKKGFIENRETVPNGGENSKHTARGHVIMPTQNRYTTSTSQVNPAGTTGNNNCRSFVKPEFTETHKQQLRTDPSRNLASVKRYKNNKNAYENKDTHRDMSNKKWNTKNVGMSNVFSNLKSTISSLIFNKKAKKTIKETTIHTKYTSNIKGGAGQKAILRNKDRMKKTTKQTLLRPSEKLNIKGNLKRKSYNLDSPKKTNKQVTVTRTKDGHIGHQSQYGYITTNVEAKETTKEQLSTKSYTGNATQKNEDGYKVAEMEPRTTIKEQTTANSDYAGGANSYAKESMSYGDIYNATINDLKELTLKGRKPTGEGDKKTLSGTEMNVNSSKILLNKGLNNNVSRVYNEIPNKECHMNLSVQNDNINDKMEEMQKNRMDGTNLEQLASNPYNISIVGKDK